MSGAGTLTIKDTVNLSTLLNATAGTVSLLATNNTIGGGIQLSGGSKLLIGANGSMGSGTLAMNGGTFVPGSKVTSLANPVTVGLGVNSISNVAPLTMSGSINGAGRPG